MSEKLAIYAGSFDLLTTGHLWMIEQGACLFDRLLVSIGTNPNKQCMFSLEDRLKMLKQSTKQFPHVTIESFPFQYLITYAGTKNAQFLLRGIRSQKDYEAEREMRNINGDFNENITTIFLIPPRKLVEVSSSMVKGLIGPQGWQDVVKNYLPEPVFEFLIRSQGGQS